MGNSTPTSSPPTRVADSPKSRGDVDFNDPRFGVSPTALGIRIEYLDEFIESLGGNERFLGMSVLEVDKEILAPLRLQHESSLCSLLLHQNQRAVGIAGVYVTCSCKTTITSVFQMTKQYNELFKTGKCLFLELVEALKHKFQHIAGDIGIFVWLECFVGFQQSEMTIRGCGIIFAESLKFFDKLTLLRIPYNPYSHITKDWIVEGISVKCVMNICT